MFQCPECGNVNAFPIEESDEVIDEAERLYLKAMHILHSLTIDELRPFAKHGRSDIMLDLVNPQRPPSKGGMVR